MRLIDEIHLELPFYGSRRIRDELETRGHPVNRKRVQRLMRHMGVAALYPKRRTSAPGRDHKVYPYLLTGVSVERANQVWATDICSLPMAKGFRYLVAVMDWLSRRVLSWRVSNTLDREFCVEALDPGSTSSVWDGGRTHSRRSPPSQGSPRQQEADGQATHPQTRRTATSADCYPALPCTPMRACRLEPHVLFFGSCLAEPL